LKDAARERFWVTVESVSLKQTSTGFLALGGEGDQGIRSSCVGMRPGKAG